MQVRQTDRQTNIRVLHYAYNYMKTARITNGNGAVLPSAYSQKKNTYKKVKKKGKKISKQIEVVSKPSVAYSA